MSWSGAQIRAALASALLFCTVLMVGAELARPLRSASVAYDSQVSVLYFERILSGHHLEHYLPTNPKPLLTVIFGTLYELTRDWRSLAWVTLLAAALAVTLIARLATRVAGGVAGAFVGVMLAMNSSLLFDIGYALAVPFALLGWAVAGLACSASRPRYAVAGVALACAALARIETFVLVGVVTAALAWATFAPKAWRFATVPGRAWLVPLIALVALPVMLIHDQLLTGDPLYWLSVAPRYAAQGTARVPPPGEVARAMLDRYWMMGGTIVLALIGAVQVLRERRWWLGISLVGLGPAIAAFLVYLAFRHVIVPPRYVAPIDVAVIFAAGVGIAVLARAVRLALPSGWTTDASSRQLRLASYGVVVVAAVLLAGPYWVVNPDLRTAVADSRRLAEHADASLAAIREALANEATGGRQTLVLAPGSIVPRLAVDLGLMLDEIGGSSGSAIDVAAGVAQRGSIVFDSRPRTGSAPGWATIEVTQPTVVGGFEIIPYLAEPKAGYWVVAIR